MSIQEEQLVRPSNADYYQVGQLLNRSGMDHLSEEGSDAIYERFDRLPLSDHDIERIGTMVWMSAFCATNSERRGHIKAGKVITRLAETALLKDDIITAERAAEYVSLLPGFRNRRRATRIYDKVDVTIDSLV
jgi:hypothetical protein